MQSFEAKWFVPRGRRPMGSQVSQSFLGLCTGDASGETFLQSAHAKSCVLAQFNQSQGKFIRNLDLL